MLSHYPPRVHIQLPLICWAKNTLKPNRAPSAKSEAKKKEVRKCELTLRKRSNEWER